MNIVSSVMGEFVALVPLSPPQSRTGSDAGWLPILLIASVFVYLEHCLDKGIKRGSLKAARIKALWYTALGSFLIGLSAQSLREGESLQEGWLLYLGAVAVPWMAMTYWKEYRRMQTASQAEDDTAKGDP